MSNEIISSAIPTALPKSTTADELLDMYDAEPIEEAQEIQKEAEKQVKIKEEVPKLEAAKELAKNTSTDKEDVSEQSEEEEGSFIKAKHGDEEIKIPKEATFTVSINGKDVTVKQADVLQAYTEQATFNRNMDKRISHVSSRENALQKEYDGLKTKAIEVVNAAIKGDFFSSIRSLAKMAAGNSNLDIVGFEKAYLDQIEKFQDVYTKMTPDQRDRFFQSRKAKLLEDELRARDEKDAQSQQLSRIESEVASIREKHSISEEEFWGTYKDLVDNLVGEGKEFKSQEEISSDIVAKQILLTRSWAKIFEASERVGLTDESVQEDILGILEKNPAWTVDDLVTIIEKSGVVRDLPKASVENLNRKAKKSNAQFKTASSTKKEDEKVKGLDKEDLDFLYRNQPRTYKPILYR